MENLSNYLRPSKKQNPWLTLENGVYAVSAAGMPVMKEDADESCIAVALIVNDASVPQRLWINKNISSKAYTWNSISAQIGGIPSFTKVNGVELDYDDTWSRSMSFNNNYQEWTDGLTDFSGKKTSKHMCENYKNAMWNYLSQFNNDEQYLNYDYADWFIPALGQLGLIMINKNEINEVLTKINGSLIESTYSYQSATQQGYPCNYVIGGNNQITIIHKTSNSAKVLLVRNAIYTKFE